MTIGSELRDAREQRGVSLREISERTNIRLPVLRAIENDDFRLVPGSVIMRGFLKLYAREVGLDPDDIGRRYTEQLESDPAERPVLEGDSDGHEQPIDRESYEGAGRFSRVSAAAGLAVLVLIGVGYLVSSRSARRADTGMAAPAAREAGPAQPAAAPPRVEPAAPAPAATLSPAAAAVPSADPPPAHFDTSGLRIDLQATGAVWISATADGQQVAYRMLDPGERLPIRVSKEAVLRIGIPANISVSINDQPIRPFVRPGTPTTLTITPANYRELLAQ